MKRTPSVHRPTPLASPLGVAVALALMLSGPGKLSFDRALGFRMPKLVGGLAMMGAATAVAYGISRRPEPAPPSEEARTEAASLPV